MTSLLSNDFVEEYRRIENTLRSNDENFSYNSDTGFLRLSTPLLDFDELNRTFVDFIGQNKTPSNVNLILDNITLISTNPNFQNYLPLKIQLDDKISPEFASTNQYTLEDYRIITQPKVNIPKVNNYRWGGFASKPYFDANNLGLPFPVDFIYDVGVSDTGTLQVYYNLVQLTDGSRVILTYEVGATITTPLKYLVPSTITATNSPNWILLGDRRENIFLLSSSENPVEIVSFVRRGTPVTSPPNEQLIGTFPNERFIGFLVPDFGTMVLWTDNSSTNQIIARFYGKGNLEVPWVLFLQSNFPRSATNRPLKVYRYGTDIYYILYQDTLTNILYIDSVDFRNNTTGIVKFFTEVGLLDGQTPKNLYLSGSLEQDPLVTILTNEGRHYYFKQNEKPQYIEYDFSFTPYPIKRFQNQAYLVRDGIFYSFNLDDPTYKFNISLINTYQIVGTNVTAVYLTNGFSRKKFVIVGKSSEYPVLLQGNLGGTSEDLRKRVYKLVYNYDTREYPYHLNNKFNFRITLPNNDDVKVMEIFKFIFDFRIRYTQDSISKPKPVPITEGTETTQIAPNDVEMCLDDCMGCQGVECDQYKDGECGPGGCPTDPKTLLPIKPDISLQDRGVKSQKEGSCYRHCSRRFGSAARVLGLNLPEDFNIEDFLNIYSTR